MVLMSLGVIGLTRLPNAASASFVAVGRGFCRDIHLAWPIENHSGSCITQAACEAKCLGRGDCQGYSFAPKDEMGHCWSSGGPLRDIAKFNLKKDSGSELSRCIIYWGTKSVAGGAVAGAYKKGKASAQWLLDTTALYTCYSRTHRV